MNQHTLDQPKTMIASKGYIILNEPGAAYKPTVAELEAFVSDITKVPKNGNLLGHTSRENLVTFGRDGGDTTVLGSWEQEQLDEIAGTKAVQYVDVKALQADNFVLNLYHGGGDASQPGEFAVPNDPVPVKVSLTVVYISRGQVAAQFFENTSTTGPDEITHATDNYSEIPLRFTVMDPLTQSGSRLVYIGRQFGAPVATPPGGGGGTGATPVIEDATPYSGGAFVGDEITLQGTNLDSATTLRMLAAGKDFPTSPDIPITSKTATSLVFTIPPGTKEGSNTIALNFGTPTQATYAFNVVMNAQLPRDLSVAPTLVNKGGPIHISGENIVEAEAWTVSDIVRSVSSIGNVTYVTAPDTLPGDQLVNVMWKWGSKSGTAGSVAVSSTAMQLNVSSVSKAAATPLSLTVATLTGLTISAVPVAPTTGSEVTLPHSTAGTNPPTVTIDYSALPEGTYWIKQTYDGTATPAAYANTFTGRTHQADSAYQLQVTA